MYAQFLFVSYERKNRRIEKDENERKYKGTKLLSLKMLFGELMLEKSRHLIGEWH